MNFFFQRIGLEHARSIALATLCFLTLSAASDGQRHYRNQEWGLDVAFPAGGRVCEARSGDHPHGFYAWYGGRPTDCRSSVADPRASAMGVYASYNASFETSARSELPCSDGSLPQIGSVSLRGLSFRGIASIRCAVRNPDGSLEFVVAGQAGRWGSGVPGPEGRTPYITYSAFLVTRPGRAARDIAMFRVFLAHLVIRPTVGR